MASGRSASLLPRSPLWYIFPFGCFLLCGGKGPRGKATWIRYLLPRRKLTKLRQDRQQNKYREHSAERRAAMHNFLSLFSYDFVQNAYLVGTIVAIVAAVIGYFVVLRAQAFAGEALSDISFAGATGAAILGISSLVGMFFFTILAALGMGALGERIRGRDVEIGMILSFALGLGVLVLALLIAPPAAALRLTHRPFASIMLAVILDVAIIWCGLSIAFIGPGSQLPVGFLVSALAAIVYFVAIPLGRLRAPRRTEPVPRADCKHKATYISKHHTGSAG